MADLAYRAVDRTARVTRLVAVSVALTVVAVSIGSVAGDERTNDRQPQTVSGAAEQTPAKTSQPFDEDVSPDERRVSIVKEDGRYSLAIDGEPFFVKGAGLAARDSADIEPLAAALAAAGGNAFRTWGSEHVDVALNAARKHDLQVLVGLDVATQVSGFDYSDAQAVARQHASVTAFIDRYAGHPHVLGWIVGNEPNLAFGGGGGPVRANPKVYEAIGAIVDHIHANEHQRPATVAFAFTPTLALDVADALVRVPELDFLSFQGYGALPVIPETATTLAPDRPFMITEFGPLGHWEMPGTRWGREIEEPSGLKAAGLRDRMTPTVTADATGRLLGAFAFLWGWKQERTPTWYGLLVEGFERTASADELHRVWSGAEPVNRAPLATRITLNDLEAFDSVVLAPLQRARVRLEVRDPDEDTLQTRWALREEVVLRSDGGLYEKTPPELELIVRTSAVADGSVSVEFSAPSEPGEYRLFAYSRDGNGGVATANFPFLVKEGVN